jgi:hypothetical protein
VAPGVLRRSARGELRLGPLARPSGPRQGWPRAPAPRLPPKPHERRYAVGLTDLLLLVDEPPADLGDTLLTLYDTPRIDHTRLGPATWRALAQTALGAEALAGEADDGQLLRLLALPLTEAWLSRALIIDATWERLLTLRPVGGAALC